MDYMIDLLDAAAKEYPIKALCDDLGKAESTLRNELTQQPGYKLGLKTAVMIMKKTADLRALDCIEEMFGRVAFDIPRPKPGNMAPAMALVGRLAREFGESMQELGAAMHDGRIDTEEAHRSLKELHDVLHACLELQAHLEKIIQQEAQ